MAQLRRDGPYISVTWLTRLLVGENSCEWSSGFRARHEGWSWEKVSSSIDQVGWQLAHTAGINENRQRWEEQGFTVFTENQNSFTLQGRHAALGCKPDLIARIGDSGTIIDVKMGRPSPSRGAQGDGAVPRRQLRWEDGNPPTECAVPYLCGFLHVSGLQQFV